MTPIRRSLAYSMADSYLALPLQIAGTMIISRLLTPVDTGVFAVAAVFASVASTFRDFGVAEYLIQEKELTPEKIKAAIAVNIFISWAMGFLLLFLAPLAAVFYGSPGVADVMRVQSVSFFFIPFGAVIMANFRRELDFRPIFIASLLANLTTFVLATVCALQGLGYMSLAWSSLAGVIVTVATSLWFRPRNFPQWPGLRGIRQVVNFGKFASGVYIFGQVGKGAPEMIIGRAQDMVGVALFSRASGLVEIFNRTVLRAVLPVCLPYFAKSTREQGSVAEGYLKSISYLTAIGWPFLAFVGIVAYAAIRILYGLQWIASVPLAQILCIAGAIELIHSLAKEALIAGGDVKRSNILQIGIQASRIVGLLAVVPFGLIGACWGLLAAAVVGSAYSQWSLTRAIGLRTGDVVKHSLPSLYIAGISVLPITLWAVVQGISESNFLQSAFGGGVVTLMSWLWALHFFRHPLWTELHAMMSQFIIRCRASQPGRQAGHIFVGQADIPAPHVSPSGTALAQLENMLSSQFPGSFVAVDGPISVRKNSDIFHAVIHTEIPMEVAVKHCLSPGTRQSDTSAATEQYIALQRVSRAFENVDKRYRVPTPLCLFSSPAIFVMSWVNGESLTKKLRHPSVFVQGPQWFEEIGAWLGTFHMAGPLRPGFANPAERVLAIEALGVLPFKNQQFTTASQRLRNLAQPLQGVHVNFTWLHGDCKTDNFILTDQKTYGIDVSLSYENPVEYDLAQFMNNLAMLFDSPRYFYLFGVQSRLEAAFWCGYSRTGPAISRDYLNWLRLSFLLSSWHSVKSGNGPVLRAWMLNRMFKKLAAKISRKLDHAV